MRIVVEYNVDIHLVERNIVERKRSYDNDRNIPKRNYDNDRKCRKHPNKRRKEKTSFLKITKENYVEVRRRKNTSRKRDYDNDPHVIVAVESISVF